MKSFVLASSTVYIKREPKSSGLKRAEVIAKEKLKVENLMGLSLHWPLMLWKLTLRATGRSTGVMAARD
jgi:hypothetical protein